MVFFLILILKLYAYGKKKSSTVLHVYNNGIDIVVLAHPFVEKIPVAPIAIYGHALCYVSLGLVLDFVFPSFLHLFTK